MSIDPRNVMRAAAAIAAATAQDRADAQNAITSWNDRLAVVGRAWFSPTCGAALLAARILWWLQCRYCGRLAYKGMQCGYANQRNLAYNKLWALFRVPRAGASDWSFSHPSRSGGRVIRRVDVGETTVRGTMRQSNPGDRLLSAAICWSAFLIITQLFDCPPR